MKKSDKVFAVWLDGWEYYSSIENAVTESDEPVEIYLMKPELLGSFKQKAVQVKSSAKKKQK